MDNKPAEKFSTKEFGKLQQRDSKSTIKAVVYFAFAVILFLFTVAGFVLGAIIDFNEDSDISSGLPIAHTTVNNDAGMDFTGVADCVVKVCVFNETKSSVSTGIVFSEDGYILACDHVFKEVISPDIYIVMPDKSVYNAAYIGGDDRYDISVLKIEARGLNHYNLINLTNNSKTGETVYTVGCGNDSADGHSVTRGIISAVNMRVNSNTDYPVRVIQFDAPVNPGNSGGPLINSQGAVIGLVTSKLVKDGYEGVGYAVDLSEITIHLNEIIENGVVQSRRRLGVSFEYVSKTDALINNTKSGLKIESVSPESDLYSNGFTIGDTITKINDIEISSLCDFYDVLESTTQESVNLVIYKSDMTERTVNVRIIMDKGTNSYKG